MHHRFPLYEVSLTYDATRGRWIQENHTTGKRIELLRSSEMMSNLSAVSLVRNLTTCARRSSTLIRCVLVGSNLTSKQNPGSTSPRSLIRRAIRPFPQTCIVAEGQ